MKILAAVLFLLPSIALAQIDLGGGAGGVPSQGVLSSAPVTPCIDGNTYFNSTLHDMFICKSAAWVATGSGDATTFGGLATTDFVRSTGSTTQNITGLKTIQNVLKVTTTTATDDKIALGVNTGGAGSFTGTISPADLTADRAWTLPNWPGTIPVPTTVGTTTTVLHGDSTNQPVFGPVTTSDLNFTPLTASNGTWCAQIFLGATGGGIKAANTVLAQFKTGAATTVTDVLWATNVVGTAGTGTATLDLTDTSGVVKCTVNFDCTTADSIGNGSCSSTALAANTIYQARAKAQCAGTGSIMYPYACWRWTTP